MIRQRNFRVFLPYDRTAHAIAEGREPGGRAIVSQSDLVCIAKEAAHQIVEAHQDEKKKKSR